MAVFKKTVLKVGTYHSPDGTVEVTPERLKHWAATHKRLVSNKQVVPCNWDHLDDPVKAVPMSRDTFRRRRSARDTVGHLRDVKLASDGQSVELHLQVLKKDAKEAASNNTVYVSPVIYPNWRDGGGNEYQDVITHVDFVNHPVDHSQGPFVATQLGTVGMAIRMSTDMQSKGVVLYQFSSDEKEKMKDYDDEKELDELEGEESEADEDVVVDVDVDTNGEDSEDSEDLVDEFSDFELTDEDLGLATEEEPVDEELGDGGAEEPVDAEDNILDVEDSELFDDEPVEEEDVAEMSEDSEPLREKIAGDLERAGIAMPEIDPDVDPGAFLLHLCGILRQKAMDEGTLDDAGADLVEQAPDIATMSLQKATRRAETAEARLIEASRHRKKQILDSLFKTGRVTGAEHEKYSAKLSVVNMSLNANGKTKQTSVDAFISSRATLPKNAVTPLRSMSLAGTEEVESSDGWSSGTKLTAGDAKRFVDAQADRFPGQLNNTKT